MRTRRPFSSERGASLVEFALILPVFAMLILGMFTGGNAYFEKITVTDSVREGARHGATLKVDLTSGAEKLAWEAAVKKRVAEVSGGELSETQVCAKLLQPADDPPADPACGVPDPDGATGYLVKVSGEKTGKMEWLLGSTDLTLRGEAVGKYEREKG